MSDREDQRLETAMGRMLQIGGIFAATVVLIGSVLYLKHFTGPMPNYERFYGAPITYESVHGILEGLGSVDSQSLIAIGILLLIATPICRVIFGAVGFSLPRDWFYATVSGIVLFILMFSLFSRR